ncbi:DNA cytosine methyltransferase [Achromobacter xylosoxidans]|uniref:DNA cytosine methyltransferase n=1 Tax=Alcaligenes xylosoxydans xylosoxydans TaxID=85698 RepID=UPI001F1318C3|nr:DNA cytosine methyltransferase [Achromobacter xylosoxidans]
METAIDLFAGLGGNSESARQAGVRVVRVVWAANHSKPAVDIHAQHIPPRPAETEVKNGQIRDNLPRLGHHRLYSGCDSLEDSRRNLAGRQEVDPGAG